MMRMKTKKPSLNQTWGPREEELEKNLNQRVHQSRKLLSQLARLKKGSSLKQEQDVACCSWTNSTMDQYLGSKEDPRESFNELMDTPLDFSAFVLNRLNVNTLTPELLAHFSAFVLNWLNVNTLTPELLARPTFELMKGSCKRLVELEYFLEEVCKATTNQLDWNNPEGQQYSHDLRKPLPLIPNSRGLRVIPFDHFINNDLAYLSGGVSSRNYATLVTKTKAADYGHIKWIEYLVPNIM
nr:hypothetical protein [Tanacetum cinerariifolium]